MYISLPIEGIITNYNIPYSTYGQFLHLQTTSHPLLHSDEYNQFFPINISYLDFSLPLPLLPSNNPNSNTRDPSISPVQNSESATSSPFGIGNRQEQKDAQLLGKLSLSLGRFIFFSTSFKLEEQ